MTHWRSLIDHKYLYAADLGGRDVNVTIESVKGGEVTGEGGRKSRKPILKFKGKEKTLVANSTNCKTIASIVGTPEVERWVGATITLFPTTTTDRETKEEMPCIRIRPKAPRSDARPRGDAPPAPDTPPPNAQRARRVEADRDDEPPADWQPGGE